MPWPPLSVLTLPALLPVPYACTEPWPQNSRCVHIPKSCTPAIRHWSWGSLKRTLWRLYKLLDVPTCTEFMSNTCVCLWLASLPVTLQLLFQMPDFTLVLPTRSLPISPIHSIVSWDGLRLICGWAFNFETSDLLLVDPILFSLYFYVWESSWVRRSICRMYHVGEMQGWWFLHLPAHFIFTTTLWSCYFTRHVIHTSCLLRPGWPQGTA